MKSPVRLERRLEQPKWLNWAIPLISLLAALAVGAIVLLLTGKNPLDVYHRIFELLHPRTYSFYRRSSNQG